MGLRGPIPKPSTLATSHRATSTGPSVPPEVLVDVREMYRRMKAIGDHYGAVAEAEIAKNSRRPSPAIWAALKCWKEALLIAYRIGGLSDEPAKQERDPHDELAERRRARTPNAS